MSKQRNRRPSPIVKREPVQSDDIEQAAREQAAARADLAEKEVGAILAKLRCAMQVEQTLINGVPRNMVIRFVPLQ